MNKENSDSSTVKNIIFANKKQKSDLHETDRLAFKSCQSHGLVVIRDSESSC